MTITPWAATGPGDLPVQLADLSREQALVFITRLYDARDAGSRIWDDAELGKLFLEQFQSPETRAAYQRDLACFQAWRREQADLAGRELGPVRSLTVQQAEDYLTHLRQLLRDGAIAERTLNRRLAAVSSLYRWASEPNRAASSGIARNPFPRRAWLKVPKQAKPLSEGNIERLVEAIKAAAEAGDRLAQRDLALVLGSYRIGCRVSEIAHLRWGDIELRPDGMANIHLLGKGSKARSVLVKAETLELFTNIRPADAGEADWVFPSVRQPGQHLTRQAIGTRMRRWGLEALGAGVKVYPHRMRHSHATHSIQRGVDPFTLQATLGHSSQATTAGYVLANPSSSSSLKLGV